MLKITDINQGDLLTFKAADNKFKVLLCTSTRKDKSLQYFTFAALTHDSFDKPTTSIINNIEFERSARTGRNPQTGSRIENSRQKATQIFGRKSFKGSRR